MAHYFIINTGGTIGMVPSQQGLRPDAQAMTHAFANHPDLTLWRQHQLSWKHWSPLLDSSDLSPNHWFQMRDDLRSAPSDIDGVLIIHGTDTLAFSAAALSYLLNDIDIPVVLTAAMQPIGASPTDALTNLNRALVALQSGRKEVMVAVTDEPLPGSRITKVATESDDAFTAPFWHSALWQQPPPENPLKFDKPYQPQELAILTTVPGLSPQQWTNTRAEDYQAILINAFGNGNAADTPELRSWLKQAQSAGTPVFVRSQCLAGDVDFQRYAAGQVWTEHGAIGCGRMTLEACVTKLLLLSNQCDSKEALAHAFQQPMSRELQR